MELRRSSTRKKEAEDLSALLTGEVTNQQTKSVVERRKNGKKEKEKMKKEKAQQAGKLSFSTSA